MTQIELFLIFLEERKDTNGARLPKENFLKLSTDFRISATFLVENPGTIFQSVV